MTLEAAYEKMDGLEYKLDGVRGTIRVSRINGMTEVEHFPNAAGRRTKAYREVRRQLKDDYTTTVTYNFDVMGELFALVSD